MLFVKAICGDIIHKNMALVEGQIAELEPEQMDHILKLYERQGLIKSFDSPTAYEDAVNFRYKGISVLAKESMASLNPESILSVKNEVIGTVPFKAPTLDFAKHIPISPEMNYVDPPKVEEVKKVLPTKDEAKKDKELAIAKI